MLLVFGFVIEWVFEWVFEWMFEWAFEWEFEQVFGYFVWHGFDWWGMTMECGLSLVDLMSSHASPKW